MPYAAVQPRIVHRIESRNLSQHEDGIELLTMGDLHVGDGNADLPMIHAAVKWLLAEDNRYAVIVGDLFNAALRDSVSDPYTEQYTVQESRELLVEMLSPVAERVLGVISGNHDHRVNKAIGDDPAAVVCALAGMPYSGGEAFLNLKVGKWKHATTRAYSPVHYATYLHHGFGGGRLVGGKANNLQRLRDIVSADLYVSGHTHTPLVIPDVTWEMDANKGNVIERKQLFIATGSSVDRGGGYAVRFGFKALAKVWPVVHLAGTHKAMTATVEA